LRHELFRVNGYFQITAATIDRTFFPVASQRMRRHGTKGHPDPAGKLERDAMKKAGQLIRCDFFWERTHMRTHSTG